VALVVRRFDCRSERYAGQASYRLVDDAFADRWEFPGLAGGSA
jgi:hypothetical protein